MSLPWDSEIVLCYSGHCDLRTCTPVTYNIYIFRITILKLITYLQQSPDSHQTIMASSTSNPASIIDEKGSIHRQENVTVGDPDALLSPEEREAIVSSILGYIYVYTLEYKLIFLQQDKALVRKLDLRLIPWVYSNPVCNLVSGV